MIDTADKEMASKALLPAGLRDLLPPDAQHEATLVERLMAVFSSQGYDRVKPPLIEFEDGLLAGSGAALAHQTFRLMDPVSQRMLGLRADMTLQVARIAASRLGNAPRPLRLSYAGQVLRVKGNQLRPERQFGQVGAELIGSIRPEADAEIVLLAAATLEDAGVKDITIDLTVPTLVPSICDALGLAPEVRHAIRAALDRRAATELAQAAGPAGELLVRIMACCGPADAAVRKLAAIDLPDAARPERQRLVDVVHRIAESAPDLHLTVDPVEQRGFEYQTGVSFTIFARNVRGELGRGGRYWTGDDPRHGEAAIGVTLYTDTVRQAVPAPEAARRILLPHGTPFPQTRILRAQGWRTVAELEPHDDPLAEARRLGCGYLFRDGQAVPV